MKIVFYVDAIGQLYNCIAIAQRLRQMRHSCIFLVDLSYSQMVEEYGFECVTIKTNPSESAKQAWNQLVNSGVKYWRKKPIDQIKGYMLPYYSLIVESSLAANPNIEHVLKTIDYDVLCVDDVVTYPAVIKSSKPWVRIISCFETEVQDDAIPSHLSDFSTNEVAEWKSFDLAFNENIKEVHQKYNVFLKQNGVEELPLGRLLNPSPYLNLLLTPKSIAYKRKEPLSQKFIYLNASVRVSPNESNSNNIFFDVKYQNYPLIYLSYGSMGHADFEFTNRQLQSFKNKNYRVIASVGDEFISKYRDLSDNIQLVSFTFQPDIIKQADVVIFHGGNNTFNEVLYFGKPSIVIPFAWDGFNVAARVQQLGLGIHIPRYSDSVFYLDKAINKLLHDKKMAEKLAVISEDLQKKPGSEQAAHSIVQIANKYS
ncbi:nucleotide disphospho-sugar-binding domain-containing protein [Francisella sp. 19X1-34]|uniref:nucleotide disphospho-sugar-binding domain-containing protein n=1 Tax=Francisella sp. 19X1-34 TaxID=3087177 RepID=UPI002E305DE0|nr:nucleotide disphospho-sugar-binding domain-containing protein [Francisella sp. 19X1-34]MED7787757.1 glycosyltransferase [Francisella sp. 19X1-34]